MVEQSLRMQVSLVSFGIRVPCAGGHVALYTVFSRGERSCHEVQGVERRAGNGQRRGKQQAAHRGRKAYRVNM